MKIHHAITFLKLLNKVHKRILKLIDYNFYIQLGCSLLMLRCIFTKQYFLLFFNLLFLIISSYIIECEKKKLRKRLHEVFNLKLDL